MIKNEELQRAVQNLLLWRRAWNWVLEKRQGVGIGHRYRLGIWRG